MIECMNGKKSDGIRYEDMLKKGWVNLGQVPDEHKTPELCMEFVRSCGYNLKYVPEEMKTREMCLEAYRSSPAPDSFPDIVASIPDKNLVFQCLVDSLDRPGAASFASAMRPEQFDDRIADYLVDIDGNSLQYMPKRMHTEERLFRAVLSSGNQALSSRNIREELKTDELYMAGIRANRSSFLFIPRERRTAEMCMVAENEYPYLFLLKPDALPDSVKNGNNIFTFARRLKETTGKRYSVDGIRELYQEQCKKEEQKSERQISPKRGGFHFKDMPENRKKGGLKL